MPHQIISKSIYSQWGQENCPTREVGQTLSMSAYTVYLCTSETPALQANLIVSHTETKAHFSLERNKSSYMWNRPDCEWVCVCVFLETWNSCLCCYFTVWKQSGSGRAVTHPVTSEALLCSTCSSLECQKPALYYTTGCKCLVLVTVSTSVKSYSITSGQHSPQVQQRRLPDCECCTGSIFTYGAWNHVGIKHLYKYLFSSIVRISVHFVF